MEIIERLESGVRSYVRCFPAVFGRAEAEKLYDREGNEYLDFFTGAGTMNYGHNNPHLREALLQYLSENGIAHSLDMATEAKCRFLESFDERILKPREMSYRMMFPGPTGTNAVEAVLKLARKVKGRPGIVAFTNAFHGMTLGSLAATGNALNRAGAGVPLEHVWHVPFEGYHGEAVDTIALIDRQLSDPSGGVDRPAAFLVETVQAEGGVNVASIDWLQRLQALARRHDALLIVDDIQVGCGRTGPFFSFEPAGLDPDMIVLSKSLSGFGLPFALALLRPELDIWSPGEHNGTFRGNDLAFVTARAALERYWADDELTRDVRRKGEHMSERLREVSERWGAKVRGRGMIQGVEIADGDLAREVSRRCFEKRMLLETAGPGGRVLKLMPPLTIPLASLDAGLDALQAAGDAVLLEQA